MVGYMNDEALRRTLTTGRVTFWSRSRQEYWRKGDTSGHVQYVKGVSLDCDGDALLVEVDQVGAACHTGKRSCPWSKVIVRSSSRVGSFLWLPSLRLNRQENAEAFLGEGERQ